MKRATILSIVFMLALLQLTMSAQYVTWSAKPVYDSMEQCADNLYTVTKNNHVGIINAEGRVIVPIEADKITRFYKGYALVLEEKKGKDMVLGVISANGTYSEMTTVCYTIPTIDFVSEGFLAVEFSDGKRGYMNTDGTVAQKYGKNIENLLPFSEGYAAIGKGSESQLVDKNFRSIRIPIGGGSLNGVFSVCNGVAMAYNSDGYFYEFDTRTGKSKPAGRVKTKRVDCDYLGAVKSKSTRPMTLPYDPVRTNSESSSIKVVKQGGKYGYQYNGNGLVPYQFDYAEPFYSSYAVAKLDNKYGLLALHNGSVKFAASPFNDGKISYKQGKSSRLSHKFTLTRPSGLGDDIQVSLINPEGNKINATGNDRGQYEFLADASYSKRNYTVEVSDNGLRLWQGTLTYQYVLNGKQPVEEPQVVTPPVTPDDNGKKEEKKEKKEEKKEKKEKLKKLSIQIVSIEKTQSGYKASVRVSNPNATAVETTVTVEGKGLDRISSETVTVLANSSRSVSISFLVPKAATYKIKAKESKTKAKSGEVKRDLRPR